jgi:RNA polymerase sigma factor (sigma-70 family)
MSVEQGFDSYEAPQESLDPSQPDVCYEGLEAYKDRLLAVTEYHTGDPQTFLTSEEEIGLAVQIQAGLAIAEEKKAIEDEIDARDEVDSELTERYLHVARIYNLGRKAEEKLVETHLRFGARKARDSMGLYSGRDLRKEEPQSKRYKKRVKPSRLRGQFIDNMADLSGATADLERRTQAASIGLIKAARNFDPINKSARFTTYASWQIEQEIVRGLHEEATGAYVPPNRSTEIAGLNKLDPNDPATQEKAEKLAQYQNRHKGVFLEDLPMPVDVKTNEEEPLEADEVLTAHANPIEAEIVRQGVRRLLDKTLDTISTREASIIRMRFGLMDGDIDEEPYTFEEIAKVVGVTRERIRQIESGAISKLRHPTRSQPLNNMLPFADEQIPHMAGEELKLTRAVARLGERATAIPPAIETWQANEQDVWEEPVRHIRSERGTDEYKRIGKEFRKHMLEAPLYTLQASFEDAMRSPYPKEWVTRIEDTFGTSLTPGHIEDFWNSTMGSFIETAEHKLQGDFSYNRVGQLFSALLIDRIRDTDEITLSIPIGAEGKIGFLGAWQHSGRITILGSTGDYTGYGMQQTSQVVVKGDVGDYAGAQAKDYASLEVEGDCGANVGYKCSGDSSIIVEGSAKQGVGAGKRGKAEITVLNSRR